jgi:hypothetical protein
MRLSPWRLSKFLRQANFLKMRSPNRSNLRPSGGCGEEDYHRLANGGYGKAVDAGGRWLRESGGCGRMVATGERWLPLVAWDLAIRVLRNPEAWCSGGVAQRVRRWEDRVRSVEGRPFRSLVRCKVGSRFHLLLPCRLRNRRLLT